SSVELDMTKPSTEENVAQDMIDAMHKTVFAGYDQPDEFWNSDNIEKARKNVSADKDKDKWYENSLSRTYLYKLWIAGVYLM
uniref:hypothetical protein n=1 Tax=Mycoplasmopsis bovis TaxID=28903 RepID=UPI003D2B3E2F